MMMKSAIKDSERIKRILAEKKQYRECLFSRGYFITDDNVNESEYPFYTLWKKITIDPYTVLVHKDQDVSMYQSKDTTFLLIGHAYNPFNGIYDEKVLISVIQ